MKKINKAVYLLSLLSFVSLTIFTLQLDIVPTKYLIPALACIVFIYIILGLLSFQTKNKILAVILTTIEVLIAIAFVFAGITIDKTNNLITKVSKVKTEENIYYVIVHKDSNDKKLEDINKKEVGTYQVNDENYDKAKANIYSKVSFKEKEYNDILTITNDLLTRKVDAIILSDFHKEIIEEEIEKFASSIRIIHKEIIELEQEKQEVEKVTLEEPFNVLISGIDTRGPINKVSRSDVNIVVSVNPTTHEILLTSIPRDYYVRLHGTSGYKDKLTHAGIYGIDMSVNTISDLLNTKIDYYLRVNFDTVVNLVDAIGGVDVYSDMAFTTKAGNIVEGQNHLDGNLALWYSRERKQFAEGDRKRGKHQEEVITAIINKISTSKVLLTRYSSILDSLKDTFQTSISADMIKNFIKNQLDKMPSWNIVSISVDGTGSYDYTYSMPGRQLYVMIPDQTTVDKASNAINTLMSNASLNNLNLN